ncbi:MAG: hypothetical protein JSS69_12460 [Acidobacteria bacterium]|nr:hypothetical protein [Acidobacteriota bacterium]MBS1866718.1 hypothetical protein [Acidobacteriota bacterium]
MESRQIDMANGGQFLSKVFFWSFERGSWQYDLAVIAILIFVFFTPHKWLRDQPESSAPSQAHQIELLPSSGNQIYYRVDTRVLAPPEQIPQLQNELHRALQRAVPELQNGRFEILNIEAQRDDQGIVIAYKVSIRRK